MIGFNKCKLIRRLHSSGEWAEFQGFVTVTIQSGIGLTFRDAENSSILCDLPKPTINSIELVRENKIFKIELKKDSSDVLSCVAFKVDEAVSIDDCVTILQENDFHLNKIAPMAYSKKRANSLGLLPDINNPNTQQLIMQLLLRDDFHVFVQELGEFLNDFQTNF